MPSPLHPDHALVRAYLAGDAAATEWLVERLALVPRIVRHFAKKCRALQNEDLADVAQEAAATALERLETYHGKAPFDAWLWVVCANTLRSFWRRYRRTVVGLEIEPGEGSAAAVDVAAATEEADRLRQLIADLGGAEAATIQEYVFEGRDFADIAARSGIPVATLRTRFYRGIERLRRRLAPMPTPPADAP